MSKIGLINKRKIGYILGTYAFWCFLVFGVFYYVSIESKLLFINNTITSLACLFFAQLLKNKKIEYQNYSHSLIVLTFSALVVINLTLGGISSPMLYWFLAIILGAGFMLNSKWMAIWGMNVATVYLVCLYLNYQGISFEFQMKLNQDQYWLYHISSLIGVITLIALFAWSYIETTQKYNKELQESYDRNNFLLKVLNHDLANPLTVLDINAKLLKPENAEKIKEKLIESNKTIIDILNSVKSIDKFHISEVQLQKMNLNDCVMNTVEEVKTQFSAKEIEFQVEVPEDLEISMAKSIFKNQILKNILTNACKFSQPKSTIQIKYQDNKLIISDSGVGIPSEMINGLFDYKSNNSRKGTLGEKGTGFGLPIVKDCCDKMNIEITVESSENGTDFNLKFAA